MRANRRERALVLGPLLVGLLTGCPAKPKPDPRGSDASKDAGAFVARIAPSADAAHGKELVATFQCNRCHEGTGHASAPANKHCVQCHKDIIENRFEGPAASIARWKPRVKDLSEAPSLEGAGNHLTREWVEGYLLRPNDLRPHLAQFMPRLAMTASEARDIAAYLVPGIEEPVPVRAGVRAAVGDLGNGRKVLDTKGCGSCHTFGGIAPLASSAPPPTMTAKDFERGRKLAPDLRFARSRMTPAKLRAWLQDPKAVKSDSAMPKVDLSPTEIEDAGAFILSVELEAAPSRPVFERLPTLSRKVTFKEVDEKVFHRTCWHCHSEPDYAIGDGGPGNSGGFGFKPRGLNLSDYNGIAAGFLDDKGERASIFARDAEGVPRIVRALLARHAEESGVETGPVRGMPLGYAPLSAEDIQLVESWIAQGRPR